MDALHLWEALGSGPSPSQGAALLLASGRALDVDEALDEPLAVSAAYAVDELVRRCPQPDAPYVDTSVSCPECQELLEVRLDLALLAQTLEDAPPTRLSVHDLVVRAPTTRDLLAALSTSDPVASLRHACIESPTGAVPDGLETDVNEAAELLAGGAALTVNVICPQCAHELRADLDVVALLAEQVSEEAHRLLADVAELATAYGWSESAILALPDARRATYLELSRRYRDG